MYSLSTKTANKGVTARLALSKGNLKVNIMKQCLLWGIQIPKLFPITAEPQGAICSACGWEACKGSVSLSVHYLVLLVDGELVPNGGIV